MDHVTTEDISWMSATHISEQVRRQELSPPVDIATSMTDRIKAVNPQLNAYVTFDEEQVTTDAERLQTQVDSGAALGPLHGVPFAVKELTAMSGLPATYGYLPLKGTVAQHDAAVVKRLKAAGGGCFSEKRICPRVATTGGDGQPFVRAHSQSLEKRLLGRRVQRGIGCCCGCRPCTHCRGGERWSGGVGSDPGFDVWCCRDETNPWLIPQTILGGVAFIPGSIMGRLPGQWLTLRSCSMSWLVRTTKTQPVFRT